MRIANNGKEGSRSLYHHMVRIENARLQCFTYFADIDHKMSLYSKKCLRNGLLSSQNCCCDFVYFDFVCLFHVSNLSIFNALKYWNLLTVHVFVVIFFFRKRQTSDGTGKRSPQWLMQFHHVMQLTHFNQHAFLHTISIISPDLTLLF